MIRRWLRSLSGEVPRAAALAARVAPSHFSLNRLAVQNPGLADHYRWSTNPMLAVPEPWWLHLGCGDRVLDGFVNLDFIPHDGRVMRWNLLDLWPDALTGRVEGVFSEDTLEHFYHAEQIYILCNVNHALQSGAVARTLMPGLHRLVEYCADFEPEAGELLHRSFGVETAADALNIGLRFSGHRWLHDPQSLRHMAELCGFDVVPTDCVTSTVEKFNRLNLRDETNSASFASDLRKRRQISRVLLTPQSISRAQPLEDVGDGAQLFVATAGRPVVEYELPHPAQTQAVACINIRSSNLSSFSEHSLKTLVIDGVNADRPWSFDETLKSRPCMNVVAHNQLRLVLGEAKTFSKMSFSPAANAGEYFTVGCAEVFALE